MPTLQYCKWVCVMLYILCVLKFHIVYLIYFDLQCAFFLQDGEIILVPDSQQDMLSKNTSNREFCYPDGWLVKKIKYNNGLLA